MVWGSGWTHGRCDNKTKLRRKSNIHEQQYRQSQLLRLLSMYHRPFFIERGDRIYTQLNFSNTIRTIHTLLSRASKFVTSFLWFWSACLVGSSPSARWCAGLGVVLAKPGTRRAHHIFSTHNWNHQAYSQPRVLFILYVFSSILHHDFSKMRDMAHTNFNKNM